MAGFYNTQRTTLPPFARPADPRLHPEFLPVRSTVRWEMQAAVARSSRRPWERRAGEPEPDSQRAREPKSASFISNFSPIIPRALEACSFSANPVLDCLPLLWATSSYSPFLLLPSDLIRFLCITAISMYESFTSLSTLACVHLWVLSFALYCVYFYRMTQGFSS